MYGFIDRPVTALDQGGRFLIWCMRNWVRSMSAGRCPCAAIGPAFGQWGMVHAMPHFHMAMMTLNREGLQNFRFAPVNCNRVREDEALVMSFLVGVRDHAPTHIRDTAAMLVGEDGIVTLITAAAALGNAMTDANIFPDRPGYDPAIQGIIHE